MTATLVLYVAGLVLALWRTDAGWPARFVLAILWPLGPLAFMVTVSVLLAVSVIAFPAFGAIVAALALIAWWLMS